MPHRTSWISVSLGFIFLTALFALVGVPGLATPTAWAEDEKEADIIVQFGDQNVVTRDITFTESISGLRALELSGLDVRNVRLWRRLLGRLPY